MEVLKIKSSRPKERTGLALWPGTPVRETLKAAKLANLAGLDSVWVTESTLAPGRDAISILGALAATTSRVKLATGIINIFTRTPTLVASTAATLDELSSQRLILGLGTGHRDPITNWHSVKFEKPLTRMREYVEVIRRILKGELISYEGQTVNVEGFKLAVPNIRRVPIYIAAVGTKMAQLAGTIGDGVLVTLNTVKQLRSLVGHAARAASASKNALDTAAYVLSCISEDRDAGLETARRVLAMYSSAPFYTKVFVAAGYEKEAMEIAGLWRIGDRERATEAVSEQMLRDFVAVGVHETLQKVTEYRNSGVDLPIISMVYTPYFEKSLTRLLRELRSQTGVPEALFDE